MVAYDWKNCLRVNCERYYPAAMRAKNVALRIYDLSQAGRASHQLPEFASYAAGAAPLLGMDVGTRHIGLALSDAGRHVAFAHSAYVRGTIAEDVARVRALVHREGVRCAVVGMPVAPLGKDSDSLQRFILAYASAVFEHTPVHALAFWDESYTSVQAKDSVRESRKRSVQRDIGKRKKAVDAGAASLILQEVLDCLSSIAREKIS